MAANYEEIRKLFRKWDIEDLKFGFLCEFNSMTEDNFDEGLLLAYLDAIDEKLPPPAKK